MEGASGKGGGRRRGEEHDKSEHNTIHTDRKRRGGPTLGSLSDIAVFIRHRRWRSVTDRCSGRQKSITRDRLKEARF